MPTAAPTRSLSLRLVFSALAFVCGAVVAALTLTVTILTGYDALRTLGRRECTSILQGCAAETKGLFFRPQQVADALSKGVTATPLAADWPSNSDALIKEWTSLLHLLFNQCNSGRENSVTSAVVFFADNTNIVTSYGYTGDHVIFTAIYRASPIGSADPRTNQSALSAQTMSLELILRNATNRAYHPLSDPLYVRYANQSSLAKVRDPGGLWSQATAVSLRSPFLTGVVNLAESNTVTGAILLVVPLFRHRADDAAFAFASLLMPTTKMSSLLARLIALTNAPTAVAVVMDAAGYLVASSLEATRPTYRIGPAFSTTKTFANETCAAPVTQQAAIGTTFRNSLCRTHMSYYAYRPLAALDADWVLDAPNGIDASGPLPPFTVYDVDGTTTYAVASRVDLGYPGFVLYTVVIISEDSVLGDVKTSYVTVIGITVGLLVAVGVVSFVLTTLLLAPLQLLGTRMSRAARFLDTEEAEELSTLHDVRALQEAYNDMNVELHRIRSFVPQSVLARYNAPRPGDRRSNDASLLRRHSASRGTAETGDSSADDSDTDLQSNATLNADRATARSDEQVVGGAGATTLTAAALERPTSVVTTKGSPRTRALSCEKALRLSVRRQLVTVFVARLRGVHTLPLTDDLPRLMGALSGLADTATRIVTAHGGIVALYSGDSVMATFNAVKKCEGHATRGSIAACRLVKAIDAFNGARDVRDFRAGVSTGMCMVGNVGSETAKNHSTMGSAVSEASALETLSWRYGAGCRVLGTRRLLNEADTNVMHVYVDIVKGSASPEGPRAIAVAALYDRDSDGDAECLVRDHFPLRPGDHVAPIAMPSWLYRDTAARGDRWSDHADESSILQLRNECFDAMVAGNCSRALRVAMAYALSKSSSYPLAAPSNAALGGVVEAARAPQPLSLTSAATAEVLSNNSAFRMPPRLALSPDFFVPLLLACSDTEGHTATVAPTSDVVIGSSTCYL